MLVGMRSGVMLPALSLNFTSGVLDSRITFSRPSLATYFDSTGKLTYAPNNLLLNIATLSTQSVTVAPIKYILSFTGTGSVTLSGASTAGPLNGTGASNRVSLAFTPTAGSLTLTVSGTVTEAQLEAVTYQTTPSTYVATTASAYYGPRFEYDPVTLVPRGLLIEEARTNLLPQSDVLAAPWSTSGATRTVVTDVSPSGVASSVKLTVSNTSNVDKVIFNSSAPTVSAITYTASVFAKAAELSWIYVRCDNGTAAGVYFDLSNGQKGTEESGRTGTITPVGNGWFKLTVTATLTATPAYGAIQLASANNVRTFVGTVGQGVLIWGAQLEAGSFATSYIPTAASSVARSADTATMTGTNFTSWYAQTQGTFVVQFRGPASGTRGVVSVDDNTANEQIRLITSGTDPRFDVTDGGSLQADIDAGTVASNISYKFAGVYATNDFAACIGGGSVGTDTSGTLPTVDRIRIGSTQAGNILCGHVADVKYYSSRLSNTQLQSLTA